MDDGCSSHAFPIHWTGVHSSKWRGSLLVAIGRGKLVGCKGPSEPASAKRQF